MRLLRLMVNIPDLSRERFPTYRVGTSAMRMTPASGLADVLSLVLTPRVTGYRQKAASQRLLACGAEMGRMRRLVIVFKCSDTFLYISLEHMKVNLPGLRFFHDYVGRLSSKKIGKFR